MLKYQEMFEPFTGDGCTLEMMIEWVQKKTKANDAIMNQAVAEVMNKVAEGEKFPLPCFCGCKGTNIHTPINHALLSVTADMLLATKKSAVMIIEDRQKILLESQMKQLSNFEKEYNKMLNGTFWQKLKKFVGCPYEHWNNE